MQLVEKYRPRTLADLMGQPAVVNALASFIQSPYPTAFLFEGDTGVGKTSAAFALARHIGCTVEQGEFGGVIEIASGEQTADSVRQVMKRCWNTPFCGSGWRVVIVNEADCMSSQAETIWLDALENIPARCVVIFTTNNASKMSNRFADRCERVTFVSDLKALLGPMQQLAAKIWKAETGRDDMPSLGIKYSDGKGSFRRMVQNLTATIRQQQSAPLFGVSA
jgi:DNA polymerase III gamma/tau subunit